MVLITCPECQGSISDKAPSCPHCGCPADAGTVENQMTNRTEIMTDGSDKQEHHGGRIWKRKGKKDSLEDKTTQRVTKACKKAKADLKFVDDEVVVVGETMSTGENVRQVLKAQLPFMKRRLQLDRLQVAKVDSKEIGRFFLVQAHAGKTILQHEFLVVCEGHLPRSVAVQRSFGGFGKEDWVGPGGTDDAIAKKAKEYGDKLTQDGMFSTINADHEYGAMKIKLKWGIQAVPINSTQYVYVMQSGGVSGFTIKYKPDFFLARILYFRDFVQGLPDIDGDSEQLFLFPCKSLYLLLEMFPDQMRDVRMAR